MRITLAVVTCALFFAVTTGCQEIPWREITIESRWASLAQPQNLKLVFSPKNGAILFGKQRVDPKLVDALIASLTSTVQAAPTPSNLGITQNWLERNVQIPQEGAPNQQALFKERLSDLKTIEQLLPSCFKFWKSDDYPSIRVTVVFANGKRWIASSDSYCPFMVPWRVSLNGKEQTTYNADISRGIAALMPEGSLNRNRLSDEELRTRLAEAAMTSIKDKWDLLGVENQAPASFEILHRNFEVEHARISPYRSVDYGWVGDEPGPHEKNLLATLRKRSLPPHVAEDVILLFHDGRIEGVEDLAERIAPYEELAFSVPWLNLYLAGHHEQDMYIRFVHDRSFSPIAMKNFAADMKELGKDSLANEVASVQDKVVLVFLDYGSWWVILPDKRMVLWRHYLPASFLKWTATDFTFERCAEHNANNGGCAGAVVSADGALQR